MLTKEETEQLRHLVLATGNPSLILAWAEAEMERQCAEIPPEEQRGTE